MATSRQLQQAAGLSRPAAPAAEASASITVVHTGHELQWATLNGARDIEIRAHLDMRNMHRIANPLVKGVDYGQRRKEQAVLYASRPLRSIRGNCQDPDAAGALALSDSEASALVPLKPFQCLVLIAEPWLMVNNGEVWLDNVHLQMRRTLVQPIFWMISAGAANGAFQDPITGSDIYTTNVTFQAEQRGAAMAMVADITGVSVYVEDCIIADWASFRSPFIVKFQSVFHIRNTLFLNSHISAELVDVSQEGVVHMQNVSLANVTLDHGAIVSTTLNDYQQAIGYFLSYYADDDEAFDVPVEVVPIAERGVFGAEFVVVNSTLGDCVYLLAGENVIEPGCPPESVARREEMKERAAGRATAVPFEVANIGAQLPAPANAELYDYPVAGEEDLDGILQLGALLDACIGDASS